MIDPTGALIVELRDDSGIAAIFGARIRGLDPEGASKTYEGDSLGAGHYKAFLVLASLSLPPHPRVPVTWATYAFRSYGRDPDEAMAGYVAVVNALHRRGPRLKTSGLGIYSTKVAGGEASKDPKTQQPVVTGTISLIATTQAVTT